MVAWTKVWLRFPFLNILYLDILLYNLFYVSLYIYKYIYSGCSQWISCDLLLGRKEITSNTKISSPAIIWFKATYLNISILAADFSGFSASCRHACVWGWGRGCKSWSDSRECVERCVGGWAWVTYKKSEVFWEVKGMKRARWWCHRRNSRQLRKMFQYLKGGL